MNSTRISGTITSLTHWVCYCTYRLFQLQLFFGIFQLGCPNLLFLFSTLQWVVTYMWLLVDEFIQYWWNYPHFFETLRPLLYVQALPAPTIFGIFQLGWALTLLFLFSTLQWVVTVHVTTRGWIQLAVLVELSFFETLEPLLYVG
jgi:hypothetical protein